ncbi:9-cis-epoxycarotenoid dioxygenase [Novosphingobium sp. Rr 2-17]|uniref:carotenoid oxygenase family protein n=1 Tax=Novosphingobium sp. Rr 2-17 TaxID=555793 RepID=UPI00026988F9|nr:carotenoid oxygenase family protein [Novosphingobium sp. Rr 2-17]EIZ77617.1 9-cis-epoxycarotenoid dioxygenase [Novosphingobium sp. Rr 2-17]
MVLKFPETPEFTGLYQPSRVETDIVDLEIEGEVPATLNGTFFQVSPDSYYPPMRGTDIFFNGDGLVSAFKFENGHVSLRRRYVQTDRLKAQWKERRSLTGIYRNTFTNDPLAAKNNTTANTTVLVHGGVLLAMKEDALPYALDPETLETIGVWDFKGQVNSATFTAHPKVDPENGDLLGFSCEAKGDGTPDIAYFEIDAQGDLKKEIWFKAPYAAMIHDFAVTARHVVFPLIPLTVDVERMKAGGQHFQWQSDLPQLFGVLPRDGGADDVMWFYGPKNGFQGHTLNAYEENGLLQVDMPVTTGNVFYFFPEADGSVPLPETLSSQLMRWTFNLNGPGNSPGDEHTIEPQPLTTFRCEFPRCDERFSGKPYTHGFVLAFDPALPFDETLGERPFQFFNQLAHVNVRTGQADAWFPGDAQCFQEPVFVPRSPDAAEGDGYVMALLNHLHSDDTELVVLDSLKMAEGPIARVKIPFRLRMSLHGNWTPAEVLTAARS